MIYRYGRSFYIIFLDRILSLIIFDGINLIIANSMFKIRDNPNSFYWFLDVYSINFCINNETKNPSPKTRTMVAPEARLKRYEI